MKWFFKPSVKLVFHRHADLPHRFYSRGHYSAADSVIAISKAVAEGLIKKEGVSPEKVKVVYNGVDLTRYNPAVKGGQIRKELGFDGCIVIGTVAAMNKPKGKGQQYLIEAAARLRGKFPMLRYMIAGDGEIRRELEGLSKSLGVSDIVAFTGFREQIERYIAAMDIFCLLSWDTEGLGRVMLEAQAMGKPVIGTDVGGIPETFINHKTGILIPPENTDELVKAIEFLAARPDERRNYGLEGEKFVKIYFGGDAMTRNIILLYTSLFEPRREA
jgi:glycosyltransferase involved in cell wall biosynthesis